MDLEKIYTRVTIVVAKELNNGIGYKSELPWPEIQSDMNRFRYITQGYDCIMGRKTHHSILKKLGHTLPWRRHIVLSKTLRDGSGSNTLYVNSVEEALGLSCGKEIFVIGGGQIYKIFLPYATRMHITTIHRDFKSDTYFPEFDQRRWIKKIGVSFANKSEPATSYAIWERRR